MSIWKRLKSFFSRNKNLVSQIEEQRRVYKKRLEENIEHYHNILDKAESISHDLESLDGRTSRARQLKADLKTITKQISVKKEIVDRYQAKLDNLLNG